jgi:hypothetical protein
MEVSASTLSLGLLPGGPGRQRGVRCAISEVVWVLSKSEVVCTADLRFAGVVQMSVDILSVCACVH